MTQPDPEYIENCQCQACREDRHRRRQVPLWDFIRCKMKVEGIHYDRYTPAQAAQILAKVKATGNPIPDDLLTLEAVVRIENGDTGSKRKKSQTGGEGK